MTDMAVVGLAVGISVAAGMELRRVGVIAAAFLVPWALVALLGWGLLKERRQSENRAAMFTEAVAGELRAGATLNQALIAAGGGVGLLIAGGDVRSAADDIASQLPGIGPELRSAVRAAADSGARVADLFDEIGAIAIAQAEVSREVRVATAPARATAMVFGGAPALYVAIRMQSGELSSLVSSPGQRVSGLVGLALFLAGLSVVAVILWRAS